MVLLRKLQKPRILQLCQHSSFTRMVTRCASFFFLGGGWGWGGWIDHQWLEQMYKFENITIMRTTLPVLKKSYSFKVVLYNMAIVLQENTGNQTMCPDWLPEQVHCKVKLTCPGGVGLLCPSRKMEFFNAIYR